MQALVTGNPEIRERLELQREVNELSTLKAEHKKQNYQLQDKLKTLPIEISSLNYELQKVNDDIQTAWDNHNSELKIQLGEKTFYGKEQRADAEKEVAKKLIICADKGKKGETGTTVIGELDGFKIGINTYKIAQGTEYMPQCDLFVKGNKYYETAAGFDSGARNIQKLENVLKNEMHKERDKIKEKISIANGNLDEAKRNVDKTFARESELVEKNRKLSKLDEKFLKGDDEDLIIEDNELENDDKIENDTQSSKPKKMGLN